MSLADSIILDINGVPGSGKSLLSVAIAQSKMSEWRKELMNKNQLIEANHLEYDFSKLKQACLNQWFAQKKFDSEDKKTLEVKALFKTTGLTPSDDLESINILDFYQLQYDYHNDLNNFFDERFELEYYYNYYLIYIRPMIISNMPIYDKINGRCCVIADLKWFYQAYKNDILVEPYTILILDEIDKEWNSFSSLKKAIIAGGIVYTIQMWRHLTKNRGVFIMAYQIDSSLLYQIRANAENVIKLVKHKKDTICSIPYLILDRINLVFFKFDLWLFNTYMNKKIKIKELSNEYNYQSKRFRLTAHKMLFAKMIKFNVKVLKYFSKYTVFKLFSKVTTSGEDKKSKSKSFKINLWDIANTYNNTFFFPEHTRKLLIQSEKLLFRERWSSLDPNIKELAKVNSWAYSSFFNLPLPQNEETIEEKPKKKTKKKSKEEREKK